MLPVMALAALLKLLPPTAKEDSVPALMRLCLLAGLTSVDEGEAAA